MPKKTARKTSKTKNSTIEMFNETNETNATVGLSVTGREDFENVMEHLKLQKSQCNKYKTQAQKILESVQLENSENTMINSQKTLDFTVVNKRPTEKNTARVPKKRKIFKQKNINIQRGDFLYE